MAHSDSYKDLPLLNYRNTQVRDKISSDDIWHTTYCGVPAIQAWQDFMLWENFLSLANPKAIVEIGTFLGGFSLFLYHQAYSRDALFVTVDFQEYADFKSEDSPLWINGLHAMFMHEDVWSEKFSDVLGKIIDEPANHPLVLFCDGGNKPKEMQTFVPRLLPGDLAVVHDFGTEVSEGDIDPIRDIVDPILLSECEDLKSMTRFYKRK